MTIPARLAAAMLALSGSVLAQRYQIEIVPDSIVDRPVPALRDGRRVNIESRSLQVRSIDRSEAATVHELVLFREPATGQFISLARKLRDWFGTQARPGDLAANTTIGFDGGAMRAFSYDRFSLLIRKSRTRYPSMSVGQASMLANFADYLQSYEQRPWLEDESWVRLLERLPKGLTEHVADPLLPPTRLRDLTRNGGCWRMVVDGPTGESTPIAIDDNYDLSSDEKCAQSQPRIGHVQLVPGTETKLRAPAIRNNWQTTIELHFGMARIAFPDGQTGRLILRMLYDPGSELFWWNFWLLHPTQPDSDVETDMKQFPSYRFVYIAENRIVVFSTGFAQESTERYPSFQAAQSHVLSVLERMHGNIQAHRGLPGHTLDMSGIPRDFFHQCGHAEMDSIRLTHVEKADALWQLTLSGANGNSAVVSLKDNYETVATRLSPEPPPAGIEQVIRSETIAARRDGKPIQLELRELRVRHPSDCGPTVSRVILIFDPSSHLSLWTQLDSVEALAFNPAIYETRDSIVVVSMAMPYIQVRQSIERYVNWSDLQSHVLNLLWSGILKGYHGVDLSKQLSEEFLRRPPAGSQPSVPPQVSRNNGLWQILVTGANGQTAAVQLDDEYRFVDVTLRP